MGDGKGFMQVEVTDIRTDVPRTCQSDLGVHIGAVHVYLSSVFVHDAYQIQDSFFKNAVCGWIGDHTSRKGIFVFFCFFLKVTEIDIAVRIGLNHNHRHAGHGSAGGIGAVGGGRNQADIAVTFAAADMVSTDYKQPGIFTCSA
ncbi:hypothetical protein DSECCO2_433580 [anaerobic digester metagenome]